MKIISRFKLAETHQDFEDLCQECAKLISSEFIKINSQLNEIYLEAQIHAQKFLTLNNLAEVLEGIFPSNQSASVFYLKACFEFYIANRLDSARDYLKNAIASFEIDVTKSKELKLKVNVF